MPTREEVYEALRQVEDPELGIDIVEEDISRVAREVPGVEDVDIELTWDPPWTPERMSDDAKFILGIG